MAAFLLLLWGSCLSPAPSPSRPESVPSRPARHRQRDACDTGTCQPGKMKGVTREAHRLLSAQQLPGMSTAFTLREDSPMYWADFLYLCKQRKCRNFLAAGTSFLTMRGAVWHEGSENPELQFQQQPCIMLDKNYYAHSHPLDGHEAKQIVRRQKNSLHVCNKLKVSIPPMQTPPF